MVSFAGTAQVSLNEYKYIIVPKKFDDFKRENQHQTSTLVKYLFSKKGFTVVYDDNLPDELTSDRCLGLVVDIIDKSSMFTTKTVLSLKDCKGQEVFLTQEGRSKKKEYKEAYSEALNRAFDSFAAIDYVYEAKQDEPITVSFKDDIKVIEEKSDPKKDQEKLVEQIATEEVQYYKDRRPVETDYKKAESSSEKKMVEQKATEEEQSFKSMEPVESDFTKGKSLSTKSMSNVLYAQQLPNGYQLVDSTPKILLKIYKSSMPNVYIAKGAAKDGVVYASDGKWFFEYHEGGQIVKEELNIKF